ELTRASQAIASGQWSQKVPVNTKDELGSLAEAFNEMSREMVSYINELQNQGQQLRANSERLATVLGGMVEGVIAVDSAERILFANKAAFKMIEFEGQRVVGRPYWEVLRNTDVQSVVREVLSGQFQRKREIVLPRSQSRIAFIASRLPGEPCPGVVLVLHDVTELRRLEQIRSEFVSNVGHELKTPLAAIQ
ncbi:MAG TPA: PAS domain-containing sensor histidine kinase, partial [Planctomycetaceae bacterium]|nr:PAS domain-containing sensor histidine kinase [Planctomycetaceae bacterium]